MKERIAISGSHGFLGSHLGETVGEFTHIERDGVLSAPQDYIFDLAGYGNMSWQKEPERIYEANVMRLLALLESSKETDYKALVVTSTSSVTLPYPTVYSESKLAAERVAQLYARQYDKPIVIVRPYTIIGVGEQPQHLIPKLIDSCYAGTAMPFVGTPVHDFLDVEDFVDSLLLIAQHAVDNKGKIYSVGSGIQYSNEQVLEIVERLTGKSANIQRVDSFHSYDTTNWRADTTDLKDLGWKPLKSLERTIQEMIYEYQRTNITN